MKYFDKQQNFILIVAFVNNKQSMTEANKYNSNDDAVHS
jgi:hypothetical protein